MHVYKAINAVQGELARIGIAKTDENKFDGYKFRGIDAVYNSLAPLLAKHGLLVLPRMLARTCEERESAKGGALFYVTVEAEFDFVSAEDCSKHTVRTFGEAMDRGDKATNKAMSAAYKYACFQAFCIPTEGDNDADNTSHEVKGFRVKPVRITPSDGVEERLDDSQRAEMDRLAAEVMEAAEAGQTIKAADLCQRVSDPDEKVYLWKQLPSDVRSAIKRATGTKAHTKEAA